jgi:signal transduction histidine kinase/HPt (histidine-containing phosphotransfer) domain-containing protein
MKKSFNILVVDDDPNLRKTLADILKVKGYAVATAANGAAAIAEAQRANVNVALIDLMLPDMTGIAVMEQIKTATPYTEAIILTGHASLTTAIEATTKGAFSYLLKPYEIEFLLLQIRHAIDRQQAQEEIRRLASFPRLNPQPVMEVAPSGEVSYANPAADKLFPDLRLLGGRHPLLIGLGDIYATFRQGGQTEMVREVAIGEASYEKHLYYVPESELIRITFIDITVRKQAEAAVSRLNEELENKVTARTADLEHARVEAEQANRAKTDFLVNMSHEIRTPMNGVIGMIDVLKQSGLDDRQTEMANIIHESAFALLAVIDDILDFTRIEAGKLQIGSTPMAIASVVEGVGETLENLAKNKQVELALFTDPSIPAQVLGDAGRLRQVLLHLANNAIKFSGGKRRHGKVSVHTRLVESTPEQILLEFRVADNGIGMDAATRARLFTAFTQADASTTRNFGGAGLGLAISGQLVKIMGGEIKVQSEPGTGSTFTVYLSFALPPTVSDAGAEYIAAGQAKQHDRENMSGDEKVTPAPLSREEAHRQGRLILIAEDNEINQKVILQQLKLLGQTADVADNGCEALERWQGGGYGLLLTDLHMPLMDGYELTAAIRAAESVRAKDFSPQQNPRTPIIAITANALKGEAEHCRSVGMDDYLSKPVQLANLGAMLEKWLPSVASVGRALPAGEETCRAQPDLQLPVPVDINVLKKLVGDDEATLREFLQDFRISAATIATELRTACAEGWAAVAGAAAHKLKSSARSVGALALGELCAEMERAGKIGDTAALAVLLPRFEHELASVEHFLEGY